MLTHFSTWWGFCYRKLCKLSWKMVLYTGANSEEKYLNTHHGMLSDPHAIPVLTIRNWRFTRLAFKLGQILSFISGNVTGMSLLIESLKRPKCSISSLPRFSSMRIWSSPVISLTAFITFQRVREFSFIYPKVLLLTSCTYLLIVLCIWFLWLLFPSRIAFSLSFSSCLM